MKVLVTGFGPFVEVEVNPSEALVRALGAESSLVHPVVLPTAYARARSVVLGQLAEREFAAVLLLGVAARSETVRLEQRALNWDSSSRPDIDGAVHLGQPIVEGGPELYTSTLPLDRMAQVATAHEELVEFSDSAGSYVCNHIYYSAAHFCRSRYGVQSPRLGFIHVPMMAAHEERFGRVLSVLKAWIVLLSTSCPEPFAENVS